MKKIYLAGGWFTPEQEEEHTRIYNLLKKDFDVFNPRIKGELTPDSTHDKMSEILLGNIRGIQEADIVVVIYDGKDTGTIWEAGFAYANQKPIIYYAEKLNGKKFNLMLAKTGNFAENSSILLKKLSEDIKFQKVSNEYRGEIE